MYFVVWKLKVLYILKKYVMCKMTQYSFQPWESQLENIKINEKIPTDELELQEL